MTQQLIPAGALRRAPLRAPDAGTVPDLASYDVIAVSTSGGKDSQAMLAYVCRLAREAGVLDRVVAIHADLGRVEWQGTTEVVRAQCEHLGVPLTIVSRIGGTATQDGAVYRAGDTFGDLLDYAERRGAWPSNKQRWCTSEFKRGPILRAFTALAKSWPAKRRAVTRNLRHGGGVAVRILDCMGLRAQESSARAKKVQFEGRLATRTQHVDSWLPILRWQVEHVWAEIQASGAPVHQAYSLGMPRLSCAFCIFAPKAALKLAGRHNRALLDEYVRIEDKISHTFRVDTSLRSIRDDLDREPATSTPIADWTM